MTDKKNTDSSNVKTQIDQPEFGMGPWSTLGMTSITEFR